MKKILTLCLFGLSLPAAAVDLSGDADTAVQKQSTSLDDKQWYDRVEVGGYGAMRYQKDTDAGDARDARVLNRFGWLSVNAKLAENIEYNVSWAIQTGANAFDGVNFVDFSDLVSSQTPGKPYLGAKVGRWFIDYGELTPVYLEIGNSLVLRPAVLPYGWDNGVQLYGNIGKYSWSLSEGSGLFNQTRTPPTTNAAGVITAKGNTWTDQHEMYTAKVSGDPLSFMHFSLSYFKQNRTPWNPLFMSAFSFTQPLGASPSLQVKGAGTDLYLKFRLGSKFSMVVNAGNSKIIDVDAPDYSRTLAYKMVEPVYYVAPNDWVAARYSTAGGNDSTKGQMIEMTEGQAFRYAWEVYTATRTEIGYGHSFSPRCTGKISYAQDRYKMRKGTFLANTAPKWDTTAAEVAYRF